MGKEDFKEFTQEIIDELNKRFSKKKILKFFRDWDIVIKVIIAVLGIWGGSQVVNNYIETEIEAYITSINTNIATLETNVETNTSNITDITTDIDTINTNIIDIDTNVETNATNITDITTDIDTINTNIIDIDTIVETNATNITEITTDIDTINTNIISIDSNVEANATNINDIDTNLTTISTNVTDIENDIENVNTNIGDVETSLVSEITNLTEIVVSNNNVNEFNPTITVGGGTDTPLLTTSDVTTGSTLFETQYQNCENGDPSEFIGTPGPECFGYTFTSISLDSQVIFDLQQGIASIEYLIRVYDENDDLINIGTETNLTGFIDKYNPTIYINEFTHYFDTDIDRIEIDIIMSYYTNEEGQLYSDTITVTDIKVNQDYAPLWDPAIEFDDR